MNLNVLKKFSRRMRVKLIEQIDQRLQYVTGTEDEYTRAHSREIEIIQRLVKEKKKDQFLEEVAYTWFNRLAALRFMDVKNYNSVRTISPREGESQPELLAAIKEGALPEEIREVSDKVYGYLDGNIQSAQPDREAYRTALLAMCNSLGKCLPFLFKRVDDWVSLLLPTDLLSPQSILSELREGVTEELCKDVEIIGWLYQFYISEKKDQVIANLKKNKKIEKEDIPAATQLFTPHWIVRYMVENSLGRLWLLNRPDSRLAETMEYYIPGEETEDEFLRVKGPEEIRVCDPACGSGHMLLYAFDLLYSMYEEEGFTPGEIAELIIKNNLVGLEIDERAGELAAFALTMKAREKDRFFFKREVQPVVRVLHPVVISGYVNFDHLLNEVSAEGVDRDALEHDLTLFARADNFGSLLIPALSPEECDKAVKGLKQYESTLSGATLEDSELVARCKRALDHAKLLGKQYHVVIANPPYMGGKGMNSVLSTWAKNKYKNSKSDLFAMFIERNIELVREMGFVSMITMQSWMFLSSYEKLRASILENHTIVSMSHFGARAFDSIGGEVVSTTSFVLRRGHLPNFKGSFLRLVDGRNEEEKARMMREIVGQL